MLKRYVIVGGMHESVKEFLRSNNYINSRKYLIGSIQDYRADFGRFIDDENRESVDYHLQMSLNRVFDSIPSQLASEFEEPLEWLEKAGLILRCFNLNSIEKPLESNIERTSFKMFLSDIGLLMALYPISISQEYLNDELDSRKRQSMKS